MSSLVTTTEYGTFLGRTLSDAECASAQVVLAEVSDAVQRRLRNPVARATYTRVFDTPPTRRLVLPYTPVSPTDLQVWRNDSANGDPDAFTSDHLLTRYADYDLDITTPDGQSGTGALTCLAGAWGGQYYREPTRLAPTLVPGRGAVKVTWTAGYAAVPQAIKSAVMLATSRLMLMRRTGIAVTSASLNGASYSGQLPTAQGVLEDPTVLGMLAPWLPTFVAVG